jgi:serine protease
MVHRTTRLLGTLLALTLVGCEDEVGTGPRESFLQVTPQWTSVDPGETVQLTATLGGNPATVTWETDNPSVATVSNTGLVTTLSSGFAAITATSTGNERYSANVNVNTLVGTPLTDGVPLANLSSSGARGSGVMYRIFVPDGATSLNVTIRGGTGDVDLYLRRGTPPTNASFTCASFNGGNDEDCVITNPARGTWYILLDLWDPYAGATLTANVLP